MPDLRDRIALDPKNMVSQRPYFTATTQFMQVFLPRNRTGSTLRPHFIAQPPLFPLYRPQIGFVSRTRPSPHPCCPSPDRCCPPRELALFCQATPRLAALLLAASCLCASTPPPSQLALFGSFEFRAYFGFVFLRPPPIINSQSSIPIDVPHHPGIT
jgi:hypothetical protein